MISKGIRLVFKEMVSLWANILSHIPEWITFVQAGVTLLVPIVIYSLHRWFRSVMTESRKYSKNETDVVFISNSSTLSKSCDLPLSGEYDKDLDSIKQVIGGNSDLHIREYEATVFGGRAALIYVDGMQDEQTINAQVMQILMFEPVKDTELPPSGGKLVSYVKERILPVSKVNEVSEINQLSELILTGNTALLIDGMSQALLVGTPKGKSRSIEEPASEALLRGPRLGFTEVLSENTALLRRQGRTEQLEIKNSSSVMSSNEIL